MSDSNQENVNSVNSNNNNNGVLAAVGRPSPIQTPPNLLNMAPFRIPRHTRSMGSSSSSDVPESRYRRMTRNSDSSENSDGGSSVLTTTSTALPPFLQYMRQNPALPLLPPPPPPNFFAAGTGDSSFLSGRLRHLTIFNNGEDATAPPFRNPHSLSVPEYPESPEQSRPQPPPPPPPQPQPPPPPLQTFEQDVHSFRNLVNDLGFWATRSSDSITTLEDQLFASLRENDRLRDEMKDLCDKIDTKPNLEQERRAGFVHVIGELVSIMNHSRSANVDVHEALRNVASNLTNQQTQNRTGVCNLCWEVPATVVFRPCNHLTACAMCTQKLIEIALKTHKNMLGVMHGSSESSSSHCVPTVDDVVSNQITETVFRACDQLGPSIECPRCRTPIDDTIYVYV